MLRHSFRVVGKPSFLLLLFLLAPTAGLAQLETATVSGQVVDPSGLGITGAQIKLVDIDRDTSTNATTNGSGLYTFPSVKPGRYRIELAAAGFQSRECHRPHSECPGSSRAEFQTRSLGRLLSP